jgi:hypothetical protein
MSTTTTTRAYPLKVEIWGEDGEILVSKGHHPPCPFLRRAIRSFRRGVRAAPGYYGWDPDELRDLLTSLGHDDVRYEWWRHSPSRDMGKGTEWQGTRYFQHVAGPGRGAFPVTVVRLEL